MSWSEWSEGMIKIVSDGHSFGTRVLAPDGTEIMGVKSIRWECVAGEVATATIVIEARLKAAAEVDGLRVTTQALPEALNLGPARLPTRKPRPATIRGPGPVGWMWLLWAAVAVVIVGALAAAWALP